MKKIDLSQSIVILANIGVIAGIVFLAVEIRQNTVSNQSAAYQSWVAANMALNASLIPADKVTAIGSGMADSKNLTEDTELPFAMWHFSLSLIHI